VTAANDKHTLPVPADEIDACARSYAARLRASLSPHGQLVLPAVELPAQLGLDGLAYEPRRPERAVSATAAQGADLDADSSGRSPDESARYLGLLRGVSDETADAPNEPPSTLGQLPLPLDLDAEIPQLSLWGRMAVRRQLLRYTKSARGKESADSKCSWVRFVTGADVGGNRSDRGYWSARGLVTCQKWTCPFCGGTKARDAVSKLGACLARHLSADPDHDAWMLTLTVPHYPDTSTIDHVDQLYRAWDLFVASKGYRQFAARWGIVARVRVLDATHGAANGSHGHFHVALFPTKAGLSTVDAFVRSAEPIDSWTVDDDGSEIATPGVRVLPSQLAGREVWGRGVWTSLRACAPKVRAGFLTELSAGLLPAWESAVRGAGVELRDVRAFRGVSLKLSPSEKAAAYFVKWGFADEVGSASKSRSHLHVLDAVAANLPGAAYVFKLWARAVDGRAWVSGLTRACAKIGITDDDATEYRERLLAERDAANEREGTPVKKVRPLDLKFRAHLYPIVQALGFDAVFGWIDQHESEYPDDDELQAALDAFLWSRADLLRTRDTS
jgi:hypothetical protein